MFPSFTDIFNLLLLSSFGGLLGLIGGVLFLYSKRLSSFLQAYSIPFAAGVLITVSIVGLLPEAIHFIGESTFLIVLATFFVAYLFENVFFDLHHHSKKNHKSHTSPVPLVIVGDLIHNFIDGVAIGVSYLISPSLGFITAFSTLLHEIPHEVGDFGILLKAGWKKKRILTVNILSAFATVIGAMWLLFFPVNDQIVGVLLAIAAGMFLYLGASDFLPDINEEGKGSKVKSVTALFVGIAVMLAALNLVPHSHEEPGHIGHELEEADHDDGHDDHTEVLN